VEELNKTRTIEFKLSFVQRLFYTYVKSVFGFFIPNILVPLTTGITIVLVEPSLLEPWKGGLTLGGIIFVIVGGSILFFIKAAYKAPLSQWFICGVISGILCAIPYMVYGSIDSNFLINAYVVFTFAVTPTLFMLRRASIMWKEVKSLHSSISSLKQQIRAREAYEENMNAKGLVSFVSNHGEEKWGTPEQVTEWRRIAFGLNDRFADYSPREFEEFIASLFSKMGYNVALSSYGGDYGVDIMAQKDNRRLVIQAKKYAQGNLVGNRVVRDTLGALWSRGDKAILITTSDFTEQAYQQAEGAPIELWNHRTLSEYVEKYLIEQENPSTLAKKSIETVEQANKLDNYLYAYPELDDAEPELQETQETVTDFEDEEECVHQAECPHLNVVQSVFTVRGEPRRIVKKCEDCGEILETVNIGR
jgi:hypothetical protein